MKATSFQARQQVRIYNNRAEQAIETHSGLAVSGNAEKYLPSTTHWPAVSSTFVNSYNLNFPIFLQVNFHVLDMSPHCPTPDSEREQGSEQDDADQVHPFRTCKVGRSIAKLAKLETERSGQESTRGVVCMIEVRSNYVRVEINIGEF